MRPSSIVAAVFAGLVAQGNVAAALPAPKFDSSSGRYVERGATTTTIELEARDANAEADSTTLELSTLGATHSNLEKRMSPEMITTIVSACFHITATAATVAYFVWDKKTSEAKKKEELQCLTAEVNKLRAEVSKLPGHSKKADVSEETVKEKLKGSKDIVKGGKNAIDTLVGDVSGLV